MRLEYQKYWLAIVCTWLSRDKWENEMQRLTQLKIEWHFSKSRLSAISIFARASQNSLAWRCIGTAWKDYGDRIKVFYIAIYLKLPPGLTRYFLHEMI